jgi:hypothetical protein
MAIIQISKIQQRSGNLVDLPQLDEAEFGWATDEKRLFIGKTTPNENIEILTSYSHIAFSQIDGSVGNLNINPLTAANGQPLVFDGDNWVNKGGIAGGLITLGDVSNVKIDGGAIGYVLETDGSGNLNWTPKGAIVAYIENVSQANPGIVTTTANNAFVDGLRVTITGAQGMTQLNGNSYYIDVLTANTFALYTNSTLSATGNTLSFSPYAYSTVSATTASTNRITVGNSAPLSLNAPVKFSGNIAANGSGNVTNLNTSTTFYVKSKDSGNTWITVSDTLLPNGVAGNTYILATSTSLSAAVYQTGGRAVSSLSGGTSSANAQGTNTSVQYNAGGFLAGGTDLTFDYVGKVLTVNGTANIVNVNAGGNVVGNRFIANVATGTAPIQVTSTTRVANLNVAYSNVSDFGVVTAQTTGTFYPTFINGTSSGNYALSANSAFSANITSGVFNAGGFTALGNISANNLSISNLANVGSNLNVSGNITAPRLISNIATGTAPLTVTSNTRVANLNVNYANVSDFGAVTAQTTGTFYPVFVSGSSSANYALGANANISFNAATGNLAVTLLNVTSNANVGNLGTAALVATGNASFTGANVYVADIGNLKIPGGSSGYVLQTDGTGNLSFANPGAVVASPAGSNTQVQFNDNNVMNATSAFTFNKATNNVNVNGNTITSGLVSGGTLNITGNANIGNLGLSGIITASGTITGGNLSTGGTLNATGNANVGNIGATNANITAITVSSNANVGNLGASGIITASGTITGGNLATNGTLNVTGNANVGNIGAVAAVFTGAVSGATLNITGNANTGNSRTGALVATANVSFTGSNISLGDVGNVKITGGSSGYVLSTDGSGNLTFANPGAVVASPAGSNTQVQFNDNNVMGANNNFTFNKTTGNLNVPGNIVAGTTLVGTGLTINGNGTLTGNLTTQKNLSVGLSATISGALNVNGQTTLGLASGTFSGSGAGLYSINGGNVSKVANAVYADNAGYATTAGSITSIPAGTKMLFAQTSAPTGWTKDTTYDNAALRVVSGATGAGGSVDFTSAFTSQAAGGTVGDTALSANQMPSHTHYTVADVLGSGKITSSSPIAWWNGNNPGEEEYELADSYGNPATLGITSSTGGSASHTHSFSGTSINLAVKYVDVIIATKN